MKISKAIVGVPERVVSLLRLKKQLPDASVFIDEGKVGCWYGHLGAMKLFDSDATHHLVLEEDVGVCPDFEKNLYESVGHVPDKLITYYTGSYGMPMYKWAKKNGYSWFVEKSSPSGQAHLFPIAMLKDYISFVESYSHCGFKYEEQYLLLYMLKNDLECWNTVPSLVEHLEPMNSVLGFNNKGKVAIEFYDGEQEIDWSLTPKDYPNWYLKGAIYNNMVRNGYITKDFEVLID